MHHTLSDIAPCQKPAQASVRRSLVLSVIEGAVAAVPLSIFGLAGSSVLLTGLALFLGLTPFQIGLLNALPFLGQLFQFVGAYQEARGHSRRSLVLGHALASRVVWVVVVAALPLGERPTMRTAVLLGVVAVSHALNGVAGNAWMSWMSDLVPGPIRGSYFGLRGMVATVVTMGTVLLAGWVLDHAQERGQAVAGFMVIIGLALGASLLSALLVRWQVEPSRPPQPAPTLAAMVGTPLRDPLFRRFLVASIGWTLVARDVTEPFLYVYALQQLGLSFSLVSMTSVVGSVVAVVVGPGIGWLYDRLGYRHILVVSVLGTVLAPWGWLLATPANQLPIWGSAVTAGVCWMGVSQGLGNTLMARAPARARGPAMALYGALTAGGTLLAGVLSGVAAAWGGAGVVGLFGAVSLGRLVMSAVFWRAMQEDSDESSGVLPNPADRGA